MPQGTAAARTPSPTANLSLSRLRERAGVRAARGSSRPPRDKRIEPSPCPLPQAGEGSTPRSSSRPWLSIEHSSTPLPLPPRLGTRGEREITSPATGSEASRRGWVLRTRLLHLVFRLRAVAADPWEGPVRGQLGAFRD